MVGSSRLAAWNLKMGLNDGLAVPYDKDIVVNASFSTNELIVQIGRMNEGTGTGTINAFDNGLEVMKFSNSDEDTAVYRIKFNPGRRWIRNEGGMLTQLEDENFRGGIRERERE
ncbi:hypothetical protein CCACVL1_29822 [Corchorus capsularis]|uniref:Uncharacterized protein n=1 Tax=Corchorus capsularis TaxID=210143 RepID=A0A1R3FZV7_COCAP|nr:hypothetical protein CCACVL1_29822 [Corchorus capsularis]